ncbi:MAG: bifunctional adenosylcobinamide kinase/adenosylcobinamide-phosphate guanylyltransferase [Eubacteriaceae bacterium]|jgi:adenosylcobinamide kinase/adenosylcobinamide-phosphate guanylyltransferase|nr:bifunctional adenosylcobinamide kinase/adenosylcobinamide-phosphate guanylyltransferase [Eubacteriaceae bacterium]MDD4508486.1 bifunctional adenosylcobinamide kinase/adenosylcobinamide-phosphate guanylyltransferase [Eubacteriaceae bacterium]
MGHLTFITGGARSGKSTFGEELAADSRGPVAYIATAVPFDDGMKDRIRHHQARRPEDWTTIERYRDFEKLPEDPGFEAASTILLDCLTVLITNEMMDYDLDFDTIPAEKVWDIEKEIAAQVHTALDACVDKNTIVVANEVGLGLVPAYRMGSFFRDIAGRINQKVAARADAVYFCVSGIPMKIK